MLIIISLIKMIISPKKFFGLVVSPSRRKDLGLNPGWCAFLAILHTDGLVRETAIQGKPLNGSFNLW